MIAAIAAVVVGFYVLSMCAVLSGAVVGCVTQGIKRFRKA